MIVKLILSILKNIISVSYTHLDVYKRQRARFQKNHRQLKKKPGSFFSKIGFPL